MRKLSIQRGRTQIWAAAIVHVIARLNFLFDPDNEVYITADELNAFYGTAKSTTSSKATMILKAANIFPGDPDFSSAKIANMFRLYETEDGLLIPASILDAMDNQGRENATQPGTLSHPAAQKPTRRSEPPAKGPPLISRKKMSPLLDQEDIKKCCESLQVSVPHFKKKYLKFGKEEGNFVFKEKPCPFLKNNLCSIYSHRPKDCRSFPHLHKKEFVFRLWGVVENCSICPIVFNVYEQLKSELWHLDDDEFAGDQEDIFY